MNIKTVEELKAKQAAEIAEFEKVGAIRASLPEQYREGASICLHHFSGEFATVRLWNNFRASQKFSDALAVLEAYKGKLVTCEHWKDGCVSVWPAEINCNASKPSAVMDGSHEVSISVQGGRGYGPDVAIEFWVKTELGLIEFGLPVCDLGKLIPRVNASYNSQGDVCKCDIYWPQERALADSFRTFWSEKPSFKGEYYWADIHNFEAWAGNQTK